MLPVCIRLLFLHREISRIARDLSEMDDLDSNRRLRIKIGNRYISELTEEINHRMDRYREDKLETYRTEIELREAITSISHDLRTPLTSILGYLQLIKKSIPDTEENMEYLKIAEYRAKSLQELINDLFELSAVSAHDYKLSLEPIKLNDILLETLFSFYDSFTLKGIVPDIDTPDDAVIVLGNTQAVRRVIENLIANALQYSSGGMAINMERQEDIAAITIKNAVENLTQDNVNRIFNRFYSTKNNSGYTGLGLAIAKTLMHKMGGEITAKVYDNYLYINCEWKTYK